METPNPEELLRKIEELEAAHAHLRLEMSKLVLPDAQTAFTTSQILQSMTPLNCSLPLEGPTPRSHGVSFAGGDGSLVDYSASWLRVSPFFGNSALPFQRNLGPLRDFRGGRPLLESPVPQLADWQYLNILQSMGQAIHIMDCEDQLIYWNRPAEQLYGFTAAEVLGKTVFDVLVDDEYVPLGCMIVSRVKTGETWTGLFPVRSKRGRRFSILISDSPLYDEDGTLVGVACVASDSKPLEDMRFTLPDTWTSETTVNCSRARDCVSSKLGLNPEQPIQVAIASKIAGLANKVSNKVWSKMKIGKQDLEHEISLRQADYECSDGSSSYKDDNIRSSEACHRENAAASFIRTSSETGKLESKLIKNLVDESEGRTAIHKFTSRAEAWINKKAIKWPWKGSEQEFSEARPAQFGCSWVRSDLHHDQSYPPTKSQLDANECNSPIVVEAPWSWLSPLNVSTSSRTVCGSTSTSNSSAEGDYFDFEVLWEDLVFKEQIGQGSCGTVYHGFWCGSEVAIKVFSKVEYSEHAIFSFRQEVSLMKELRHPNILLFMGAVTSSDHLSIITEFLPRGSLFRLLQRKMCKLDWRRRVQMALDIARGMNYLHCCNPPIVHRDLKSSNLLVDKNWTVKIADFGLSRIKYETYLTTKAGKGTPQWMAPEVVRHEPSDEKSDVYSFGVILWELATERAPWENLNPMQVIAAVGFMNQRLDIPSDVDKRWAAMINSCWQSDPRNRPSFQELLKTLKDLARQLNCQASRFKSNPVDIPLQEH